MKFILGISLLLFNCLSFAAETCSRVAIINYQKVLVDAGSNKKGEGLRYYLEKDPVSKALLNKYQKENEPTLLSASASTAGSFMLFAGLIQTDTMSALGDKNSLIYTRLGLIALTYLTSKTQQYSNEKILNEAVSQYNTRNTPRIYFSPYKDYSGTSGVGFGLQQEF